MARQRRSREKWWTDDDGDTSCTSAGNDTAPTVLRRRLQRARRRLVTTAAAEISEHDEWAIEPQYIGKPWENGRRCIARPAETDHVSVFSGERIHGATIGCCRHGADGTSGRKSRRASGARCGPSILAMFWPTGDPADLVGNPWWKSRRVSGSWCVVNSAARNSYLHSLSALVSPSQLQSSSAPARIVGAQDIAH